MRIVSVSCCNRTSGVRLMSRGLVLSLVRDMVEVAVVVKQLSKQESELIDRLP